MKPFDRVPDVLASLADPSTNHVKPRTELLNGPIRNPALQTHLVLERGIMNILD